MPEVDLCFRFEAANVTLNQHEIAAAPGYMVCTEPPYPNPKGNNREMIHSFHKGKSPRNYKLYDVVMSLTTKLWDN